MSNTLHERPESSQTSPGLSFRARMFLLSGVLLAEYLSVSLSVDAQTLIRHGGWWTGAGQLGTIAPLIFVAGTAAFLLIPKDTHFAGVGQSLARNPISKLWLVIHLAAFTILFGLTLHVFSEDAGGVGLAWFGLWIASAAAVPISLSWGLLPGWLKSGKALTRIALTAGGVGLGAWGAGIWTVSLWHSVAPITLDSVAWLLSLAFSDVVTDPSTGYLELEGFAVDVAPVCSGLEGIGLFLVLMLAFLVRLRNELRLNRAWLLLPLGAALIWAGNALRIATLMVLGARLDPGMALSSFHSKAGWVLFCVLTLSMGALARRSSWLARAPAATVGSNGTLPVLLPLLVWIGVGLATETFSDGHDPLYALRVIATTAVLWTQRSHYRHLLRRPSTLAVAAGALVGFAWVLLYPTPDVPSTPPLWQGPALIAWLVLRSLGACVVIPVCEELAFRLYLPRRLSSPDFWKLPLKSLSWGGIVVSSLLFGALHEQWLLGSAAGLVFALVIRRRGEGIDAVVAHAVSNIIVAGSVLLLGRWHLW